MLKQNIQTFVDNHHKGSYRFLKEKLFTKTFGAAAFADLMNATNYLDADDPVSLRVHCYMNNITTYPTCKMCANKVKFNSNKGWLTYCSNECRFKDFDCIQQKKFNTNLEKYGTTNVLASDYVLSNRKKREQPTPKEVVEDAPYLTETNLEIFIKNNITTNYKRDRKLQDSDIAKRYDFILPDQNTIIEFDGSHHYTSSSVIFGDKEKDNCATALGYNIIRIPYFVQLDSNMINYFFGALCRADLKLFKFNTYKHGFIHPKATLPADFCELGQQKFLENLRQYPQDCSSAIINSLINHSNKHCMFSSLESYIQTTHLRSQSL